MPAKSIDCENRPLRNTESLRFKHFLYNESKFRENVFLIVREMCLSASNGSDHNDVTFSYRQRRQGNMGFTNEYRFNCLWSNLG